MEGSAVPGRIWRRRKLSAPESFGAGSGRDACPVHGEQGIYKQMTEEKKKIYLDNAATEPMRREALDAMETAMEETWGNASAFYQTAQQAKALLEKSRDELAETIGAQPREIYFTSGGTEGDNWALTGAFEMARAGGKKLRIVTTPIEHHAVLRTAEHLKQYGCEIEYLPVDSSGFISFKDLCRIPAEGTALLSVMTANNEIGTIEPIGDAAKAAGGKKILLHTDAVQAYGKIPLDVRKIPVDLLSVSAHKIGGPKGIGFLYIRQGTKIGAFIHGGMQERGRRAGTENVPAAAGFAAAAKAAMKGMEETAGRERKMQEMFFAEIRSRIPQVHLNGPEFGERRLPGNVNICIPGVSAEAVLMALDFEGIAASAGSACTTGAIEPSHVLAAIGRTREEAKSSLRFSFGPETTAEDLHRTAEALGRIYERMQAH